MSAVRPKQAAGRRHMGVLRSEWTKLRSVRSTWIAAVSTIAAGAALSVLGASDLLGTSPSDLPGDWDPTAAGLKGFLFAQLVIGMLGALSVTPLAPASPSYLHGPACSRRRPWSWGPWHS
ncbi:hypothetical protein [Actinomadura rugatobispora]|uniref:Uncharacterized protein n=1 Tax=Actinomadura rugatobispora TaxID=1994 RepID=A0ABW0ZVH6_9ACTN|nr:hypothetical protein GCM10010200_081270 [Actinomadura rugatobispora]